MKKVLVVLFLLCIGTVQAQVKLYLDSQLLKAYETRYRWGDDLLCVPFYCDPFYEARYKKNDTDGLCGRYVFVDRSYTVRIKPVFSLPCWFEPRFSEGLCAVNIDGRISYIDTSGAVRIQTGLLACSPHKNRVLPFKNGRAKVYRGGNGLKHYYDVYYIDRSGNRLPWPVTVKVKPKPKPVIVARGVTASRNSPDSSMAVSDRVLPLFDVPVSRPGGKYHPEPAEAIKLLQGKSHKDNRVLVFYQCGTYQTEMMGVADTAYCGKWIFTDTLFNVRIAGGFTLPCAFEPEFSEGLCAVAMDSMIVYIDSSGRPVLNTGLKACSPENNKVSTFKNGIATLYAGDKNIKGLYTTIAINTKGERVRLLEFDELELAELRLQAFSNLSAEEAKNCFVGKGKTNGLWFLIEKSGKIRKKLEPKKD